MIYYWDWNAARKWVPQSHRRGPRLRDRSPVVLVLPDDEKRNNKSIKEIETAHRLEPLSPIISKSVGSGCTMRAGGTGYRQVQRGADEGAVRQSDALLARPGLRTKGTRPSDASVAARRVARLGHPELQGCGAVPEKDVAPAGGPHSDMPMPCPEKSIWAEQYWRKLEQDRQGGRYVSPVAVATVHIGLFRRAPGGAERARHKAKALAAAQAVKERASDLVLLEIEPRSIRYEASRPSAKSAKSWDCNKPAQFSRTFSSRRFFWRAFHVLPTSISGV
jgi:hypothetical protein